MCHPVSNASYKCLTLSLGSFINKSFWALQGSNMEPRAFDNLTTLLKTKKLLSLRKIWLLGLSLYHLILRHDTLNSFPMPAISWLELLAILLLLRLAHVQVKFLVFCTIYLAWEIRPCKLICDIQFESGFLHCWQIID